MEKYEDDIEENTFKQYYYPLSDEELSQYKKNEESIDDFFEEPKKKKTKHSSTVGRSGKDCISYISTNKDDGSSATHLIKIDIYDMRKLENIPTSEHWKHADVRLKYYTKPHNDKYHKAIRGLIYSITKEVSTTPECKKYSFKHNP